MTYESRKKKKSDFPVDDNLTSSSTFDFVKDGINKKSSWGNILDKFSEVYGLGARIFDTEADLIASDIQIDEHAIVVSNNYGLYKITSLAAGGQDVTLTSGFVATLQNALDVPDPADYTELRAIETAGLLDGTPIIVTNSGIGGEGVLRNVVAHGLTDNGGTIIVINADFYWQRSNCNSEVWANWFGALGDGSTDDYQAIIDAMDVFAGAGGIVWLRPGVYITGTRIPIPTGVTLAGLSDIHSSVTAQVYPTRSASIKQADGANLVSVIDIPSASRNCAVKQLFIDGNRANNTTGYGLTSSGAVRTVKDVSIGSCPQVGLEHSGSYALFQNMVIADCDQQGLIISGSDSYWQQIEVQNSDKSETNTYPNILISGDDNVIDKVRAGMDTGSGTDGLEVTGSNNQFTHNVYVNNARYGASIGGSNNQFVLCTFSGATVAEHASASHGLYNSGSYNTYTNCRYRSNAAGAYGAYIDAGSQYCDLDGDFTVGFAGSAYFVESTVKDVQITGKPKIGKIHGTVDIEINTSTGLGTANANTGYFERSYSVTLPNSQFLNYPYTVSLSAKRSNSGGSATGDDVRILTTIDQTTTTFQIFIAATTNMQEYRIHWLADSSRGW